jgi:hypothetical protein
LVFGSLVLVGIAYLTSLQSPLSPWSIHYPGADSSLYIYAGSQIMDGIIPYRDLLTFNGPLVFIINMFGYMIGGEQGIWYLEIAFLASTFLILFFSLSQHVGPLSAFIACITIAAITSTFFDGGNHIEEYTLLFQAIGLAGYLNYFKKQKFTLPSVYMIGLGASLAFFTKPFTLLFWVPFFFIVLVRVFFKEDAYTAFTRMIAILIGFSILFVIFIPWLNLNDALESCFYQMLIFYVDYVSLISRQAQIETFLVFASSLTFILIVFITVAGLIKMAIVRGKLSADLKKGKQAFGEISDPVDLLMKKPDATEFPFGSGTPFLMIANLLAALLLFISMAIPGVQENHVLLQGVICLAVPVAYAAQFFIKAFYSKAKVRVVFGALMVILLATIIWIPGLFTSVEVSGDQHRGTRELKEQNELIAAIESNRVGADQSEEPMVVFGNNCWIYTASDSYSATRYAYQTFSKELRPDLQEDFYRQVGIAGNTIDSLLLAGRIEEGVIEQYPQLGEYDLVFQNEHYVLYRKRAIIAESTAATDEGAPAATS